MAAVIGWVCLVVSGTAMFISFLMKSLATRPGYAGHRDAAAKLSKNFEFWAVLLAYVSAAFLFVDYSTGAPWSWAVFAAPLIVGVAALLIYMLVGSDPRLLHLSWGQGVRRVIRRLLEFSRRNL